MKASDATKADYKDWLRFKYLVQVLRIKTGRSHRDLSKEISSSNGWLSSALNYRYQLTQRLLEATEQLALKEGIALEPPLTEDGSVPTTLEEVRMVLNHRTPRSSITQGEGAGFKLVVSHLRKRGFSMRDIALDWAGYSNENSLYEAVKPGKKPSYGPYSKLEKKFKSNFGKEAWDSVISGGNGTMDKYMKIAEEVIDDTQEHLPLPSATPAMEGIRQDSFQEIRQDLEALRERILALANPLPYMAQKAIGDGITSYLTMAIEELAREE